MKQLLMILAAAVFTAALAGCNSNAESGDSGATSTSVDTTATPEPPPIDTTTATSPTPPEPPPFPEPPRAARVELSYTIERAVAPPITTVPTVGWWKGGQINDFMMSATGADSRMGYVDGRTGRIAVPMIYDAVQPFSDGFAAVNLGGAPSEVHGYFEGGKWGFVNTRGEVVIPIMYDFAGGFRYGAAMVSLNDTEFFINARGEEVPPPEGYFDYDVPMISSEGFTIIYDVRGGGVLYGFADENDEIVIPTIFSRARPFSNGFAVVSQDDKFGVINTLGEVVIPLEYDGCGSFFCPGDRGDYPIIDGRFAVLALGEGWGIVDINGDVVLPFEYELIVYVGSENGRSYFWVSESWWGNLTQQWSGIYVIS
jgi:hypothetical protein